MQRSEPDLLLRALKLALAVALFASTVSMAGCMGPTFVVQQYTGPARPRETIATLRMNGSDSLRLSTLDDEDIAAPLAADSRLHIELLPGRHVVTAQSAPHDPREPLVFQAEAGKVYRVTYVAGAARIFEVDRAADALLQDVTSSPKPPAPEPPAPPAPAPEPPAPAP